MHTRRPLFLVLILGLLSTISPLSIDMYLPSFPQIAADLHVSVSKVSLSVSSYFIGLAAGQLFYGPILDRFGRKRPIYFGLVVFMLASIGCVTATSIEALVFFRFLQALGGCAEQVGSMAMVRDFFPPKAAAKTFSLLMLMIGVSPLLAPTIGSFITVTFGWHVIFILLGTIVAASLVICILFLPEGHEPDRSVELKLKPIAGEFFTILKVPQFTTYAVAGALSFAGLFVYVGGSPVIFMDVFQVSTKTYGLIFATLSVGFIGGSQLNIWLMRFFTIEKIFRFAIIMQTVMSLAFVIGAWCGWLTLISTLIALFFCLLGCGLTSPNSAAIALEPFSKNAGSASALLGFLQMGIGAAASAAVGLLDTKGLLPIAGALFVSCLLGLGVLLVGLRWSRDSAQQVALDI